MRAEDFFSQDITQLHSADGAVLGEIVGLHVAEDTDEPFLAQVARGQGDDLLVAVTDCRDTSEGLVVPYSAESIEAGPTSHDLTGLSVGEVTAVLGYYGVHVPHFEGSITSRADTAGRSEPRPDRPTTRDPAIILLPPIVRPTTGVVDEPSY